MDHSKNLSLHTQELTTLATELEANLARLRLIITRLSYLAGSLKDAEHMKDEERK